MSNMSYCRFQNTVRDLADCQEALDECEVLSKDELSARHELVQMCAEIVARHGAPEEKQLVADALKDDENTTEELVDSISSELANERRGA
jgi:hypothetical protein